MDVMEQFIQYRLKHNAFMHHAGIVCDSIQEKKAYYHLDIQKEHLNYGGSCHGGALVTLADCTMGAATTYVNEETSTLTIGYHFLRAARFGERIEAFAYIDRERDNLLFVNCTLSVNGKEIGTATSTFMRRGKALTPNACATSSD